MKESTFCYWLALIEVGCAATIIRGRGPWSIGALVVFAACAIGCVVAGRKFATMERAYDARRPFRSRA